MPETNKRTRTVIAFGKAGGDAEIARHFLSACKKADQVIEQPDGAQSSSRRTDDQRDMLRAALVACGVCFGEATPLETNVRAMIKTLTHEEAAALVQVCVPVRETRRFTHHLYRNQEKRARKSIIVEEWNPIAAEGIAILTGLRGKCGRLPKLDEMLEGTLTSLRDNKMVSDMITGCLRGDNILLSGEHDRLIVIKDGEIEQAMCVYERLEEKGKGCLKVHYLCSAPWNIFDPEPAHNRRVRGAGLFALNDAIRRADQLTATQGNVHLDAMTDNVIAFYEKRGFRRTDADATGNFPMELVTITTKRKKRKT